MRTQPSVRARIVGASVACAALLGCLDLGEVDEKRSDAGNDANGVGDGSFPDAGTGGNGGTGGASGSGGTGGGSGVGGSGASGGASTCGSGMRCAPALPDTSWSGPFFRWQGAASATKPACPAGTATFTGGIGISPGTHTCKCDCASSVSCPTSFSANIYNGSCGTAPCNTVTVGASCLASFGSNCTAPVAFAIGAFSAGTCSASVTKQVTAASFQETVVACPTSTAGSCAGNQPCVAEPPAPFDAKLCIGKSGDATCAGGYPQKVTAHAQLSDTRACGQGNCQCGPTGDCGVTASPCNQTSGIGVSPGGTTCLNMNGGELRIGFPSQQLSCKPFGTGALTGAVTPTGSFTLCCEA